MILRQMLPKEGAQCLLQHEDVYDRMALLFILVFDEHVVESRLVAYKTDILKILFIHLIGQYLLIGIQQLYDSLTRHVVLVVRDLELISRSLVQLERHEILILICIVAYAVEFEVNLVHEHLFAVLCHQQSGVDKACS